MICKYMDTTGNICHLTDVDLIHTYTADEVFDILENYENQIRQQSKQYASAIAKGNRDAHYDVKINAAVIKHIDKLWEFIQADNADEYYIFNRHLTSLCDTTNAALTFCTNLMCKGQLITHRKHLELSLENGAVETSTNEVEDIYLNVLKTDGKPAKVDDSASTPADYINQNCRIFECKDCHTITYVAHTDDDWKREHGLKPVQRCSDCIYKRWLKRHDIWD